MSPKSKKILVIGSSGLVGGNLLYSHSPYSSLIVPAFHSYIPDEYKGTGLQVDITNPTSIIDGIRTTEPDCVVNLSCVAVTECEREPEKAHRVQVEGVRDLARACKKFTIRLIHISSDMVYSGNKRTPYTPDDKPDPTSVYGKTKLKGEEEVQGVGGNHVIVRSALVLGRGRFEKGGFLDWMVEKIHKKEKFPLFVDQLRTPVVVDDLVDIIFRLADSSFCGILLASGNEVVNRVEMGEKLLKALSGPHELINPVSIESIESPVPLQRDLRLDNARLKEVIGKEQFVGIGEYFERLFKRKQ